LEHNQHYRAFGSLFFMLHQGKLLWLLNTPVIGRWFRRVLRVSGESSSVGRRRITRILPHAIFWWDGPNQVAEFRTHAKFSKRLYYAFAPLWWAMHAWDWAFADRWVPDLSFGFSTLTVYPDADPETNTVDGDCDNWTAGGDTWANVLARAGTEAYPSTTSGTCINFTPGSTTNQWISISRAIILFDTSALTSTASISAAVLSLYGTAKADPTSISPNVDIYTTTPASNTDIVPADFSQFGSTSQTGVPITYAGWSTTGYNAFTLNATGLGNVSKTSISKFGTRNANYDVAATAPTWANDFDTHLANYWADQAGTANDPKLVVTYSTAAVTGTATASITEADIVTGGKTIIITLTGDTWIPA
jgi:hypothetical protein